MKTLLPLLALGVATAVAQVPPPNIQKAETVEAGIFTAMVVRSERDEKGVLQTYSKGFQLQTATHEIPAVPGTRFGVRFRVSGTPAGAPVRLRKVVVFPGPLQPVGHEPIANSTDTITATIGDALSYTGYRFDDPWELVPGEWRIELWDGTRQLLVERFTVIMPGAAKAK